MKYNLDNLINSLLANLNNRQRDVINSRYGLKNGRPLTLASIGGKYNVTRERIRQVEALVVSALKKQFTEGELKSLVADVKKNLESAGGVKKAELFNEELKSLFSKTDGLYPYKINFVLENSGVFNFYPEDKNFYSFWYLTKDHVKKAENLNNKLESFLKTKRGKSVTVSALQNTFKQEAFSSYMGISKKFSANAYNDFGLSCWPEICPKTSRDWAYLILRKISKPLHFTELTYQINNLRSNKLTNPQTVHNELIKDGRFVLVGRGTYGLKEFNLVPGTAKEVIAYILKKHGPLHSKDVVKLVLNQRLFKENTLLLNLQDRKHFQRLNNGKYTAKKV